MMTEVHMQLELHLLRPAWQKCLQSIFICDEKIQLKDSPRSVSLYTPVFYNEISKCYL